MNNTSEIVSAIKFGSFTSAELDEIGYMVRFARAQLAKSNKLEFTKGSAVKFVSRHTGQTIAGHVEKVLRKYIHVKVGYITYRVPADMLFAA